MVFEKIYWPTHCPILGVEIDYSLHRGRKANGPSFDRIDNLKGYIRAYSTLKKLQPTSSDVTMFVGKSYDEFHKKYFDEVFVNKEHDKTAYALDFTPWEEILAMPVKSEYDIDKTVAQIIWEITFHGYSQKPIQKKMSNLVKEVENIKAGKTKTYTCKEFFKKFKCGKGNSSQRKLRKHPTTKREYRSQSTIEL